MTFAILLVLAVPAAAGAQSAGDDQYSDPFAGQAPQRSAPAPSTPSSPAPARRAPAPSAGSAGSTAQAPSTAAAPSSARGASQAAPGGEQLPRTGLDVGWFLLTGALLLGAGAMGVRCARGREPWGPEVAQRAFRRIT
ncbi:MAG: hypothetical protein ACR2NA_01205 [Solirubrobacterales bacterium]